MKLRLASIALSVALFGALQPASTLANDEHGHGDKTKHVLLISIDGMHAVDYENCVASKTCPHLAALGRTGVNYTRTTTSRPSDSFPGLMAIVSGGSPRTVGAFYDVAYDRVLAPPKVATGNGLPGGACNVNQINGTQTEYEEGNEFDQSKLNGGFPGYSTIDGGVKSINPDRLVRDPFNNCQPVYSWNFVRTNTIFGVIHAAGGYTAWSDKHAGYASVSGPTGTNQPSNVDDYYSPEVNSLEILLPGIKTAAPEGGASFDCGTPSTSSSGVKFPITDDDWTVGFDAIKCNDQLKVNAVLNQIHGRTHLGAGKAPVPVIFGMNFQAVSVGQKLIAPKSAIRTDANSGGYEDAQGTPRPLMLGEIEFVDAAIGQMVDALRHEGLLDSTTIIITAKHGQSPIDPNRFFPIPGNSGNNGTPPSGFIGNLLPAVYSDPNNGLGLAEDDISQIWLADSSRTGDAVTALENASTAIGLGQIYYGASINTIFNPPGVPEHPGPCCKLREGGDPRTPDIVVIPNVGVVYTGNLKKQSEHGGFAWDDTNVMLLVSNPRMEARTVNSFVETAQVAPTVLKLLGLDPDALDAVRQEGTPVLPSLFSDGE
ncbi:MAG TPA: alkaline phosphatase family protein [Candidatus Dormibacteraeota bacterium]|nr:alkaline phosphatase family protein [Candidatus Dormibacteraeota bacterium]